MAQQQLPQQLPQPSRFSLMEFIDLGHNLNISSEAISAWNQRTSRKMLIVSVPVMVTFSLLAWVFDLRPTYEFSSTFVSTITPSLPASSLWWLPGLLGLVITLGPSASEMGLLPAFARAGVSSADVLVRSLLMFDAVTDVPATARYTMKMFVPILNENMHWLLANVASVMVFFFVLLCSTILLEIIAALSISAFFQLLHQSFFKEVQNGSRRERQSIP